MIHPRSSFIVEAEARTQGKLQSKKQARPATHPASDATPSRRRLESLVSGDREDRCPSQEPSDESGATSEAPLARQMSRQSLSQELTPTTAVTPSPPASQTQELQACQDAPLPDTLPETQVETSPQIIRSTKRLKTVGDVDEPDGALQFLDPSCFVGS